MNCARNYENLSNFIKVMPRILLLSFFPDTLIGWQGINHTGLPASHAFIHEWNEVFIPAFVFSAEAGLIGRGMEGWVDPVTTTVSKQPALDRYVTDIAVVSCSNRHASLSSCSAVAMSFELHGGLLGREPRHWPLCHRVIQTRITSCIFSWCCRVQVVRLPVSNCSRSSSCEECLTARDPYCGWCSHDRRYEAVNRFWRNLYHMLGQDDDQSYLLTVAVRKFKKKRTESLFKFTVSSWAVTPLEHWGGVAMNFSSQNGVISSILDVLFLRLMCPMGCSCMINFIEVPVCA